MQDVQSIRSAMVERFSASELCSDGWVVRMWVRILAATFSKVLRHNCFSPPRSKWVPVRGIVGWCVWLALYAPEWQQLSCILTGSWDGFRNDLCAWWTGRNNVQHLDLVARICALYKNRVLLLIEASRCNHQLISELITTQLRISHCFTDLYLLAKCM